MARVSLPGLLVKAAAKAMDDILAEVASSGRASHVGDLLFPVADMHAMAGMGQIGELERRYLGPLLAGQAAA